jgi:hypothetical protein
MSRDRTVGDKRVSTGSLIAVALIAAITAVVLAPNVHGFWGRDDFGCLAVVRMIGSPWIFFTTDHFFAPGSIFRPLGFASMWLCEKLFGTAYAPNAAFDIGLQVAVALALCRAAVHAGTPILPAALISLIFALHPATSATSMWWSARFDLLATLFVLLSVDAAIRFRDRERVVDLAAALLLALAAMLSKEIGLAAVAACIVLWAHWYIALPMHRRPALTGIVLALFTAGFFFLWRWSVLGTLSSGVTGAIPLSQAFTAGVIHWVQQAPGYLSFAARTHAWIVVLSVASLLVACASLYVGTRASGAISRDRIDTGILLCGLMLFAAPILLQAPIAAFGSPLASSMSAIESGMQARLYYLQIAGGMFTVAAIIAPAWRRASISVRRISVVALCVLVASSAAVSHRNARAFAHRSMEISDVARKAVAVVDRLNIPQDHCHVVFLGYAPASEWDVYVSMDSIVKALSTDLPQVSHCWIHSNVRTYMYLQKAPTDVSDAVPFVALRSNGQPVPWRTVGDFEFAYAVPPPKPMPADFLGMPFFEFRDGQFVEVTQQIQDGSLSFVIE